MAGRSYKIENGTRTLLPTERQLKRLEEIKNRVFSDENGYTQNSLFSDTGQREALIDWAKKQDPAYLLKLLKDGKMTEDYVKAMWLRNYLDRKNGIMPSDITDMSGKWNYERLEDFFREQSTEFAAIWDKFGTFLGYGGGKEKDTVNVSFGDGMLVGGTMLHNHPRNRTTGLGGGFSTMSKLEGSKDGYGGDLLCFLQTGVARMTAACSEGTYELTATKKPTYTKKDLKLLQSEVVEQQRQISIQYGGAKRGLAMGMGIYARADSYHHFNLIRDFARRHGCEYTFKPNKGFEDLLDPNSLGKPLNRYPNQ